MSILSTAFGPSRDEVWRQLCAATGARYVEGAFGKDDEVQKGHGEWTVTLDTGTSATVEVTSDGLSIGSGSSAVHRPDDSSQVTYTRMRAPYVNPSGFRFAVYRKGLFTGLGKLLGMQDVEIGHEPFDTEFVVQANDESRIRQLLASERLRELISQQPAIELTVRDDDGLFGTHFPEGVDELHFQVMGVVKDVARLKALFDLFTETLDELCSLRLADPRDPGMER
jgi:hypothetical protein